MKEAMKKPFIKVMYYTSKAIFGLHLALLIIIAVGNYFDPFGYFHGEKLKFTIRGNVSVLEKNWKPLRTGELITIQDSIGVKPIFLMKKSGFSRIDYTDFAKAFTFINMAITLLDMACWWIWLVLTYQLMRIISSLKNSIVFDRSNIKRLQIIAIVFGIVPVLDFIKNTLYAKLLKSTVLIPNHSILPEQSDIYTGIGIMLLVFVLIEIFRYGLSLQKENDLTI